MKPNSKIKATTVKRIWHLCALCFFLCELDCNKGVVTLRGSCVLNWQSFWDKLCVLVQVSRGKYVVCKLINVFSLCHLMCTVLHHVWKMPLIILNSSWRFSFHVWGRGFDLFLVTVCFLFKFSALCLMSIETV